jgi:ATP-dependent DNA helicase PIF1
MLTRNAWQTNGLYNGALGTVNAILYFDGSRPSGLPRCVLVEFDDYIGPSIVPGENIVPIVPETISFDPQSPRTGQLPLVLGWAITIHESQGLTLNRVIVDVDDNERNTGTTYVACSHVRSAMNLAFEKSENTRTQ